MSELEKEDYQEPRCLICDPVDQKQAGVTPIPVGRILEKLDTFLDRQDYAGAKRLLAGWMEEARQGHDLRGQLSLENELMGICRKTGAGEEAMQHAARALQLIEDTGLQDSVTAATTYVNAATVYHAFEKEDRSLELFRKARPLMEASLPEGDFRLGSLYNNMALTLMSLEQYGEAREMNRLALQTMEKNENGKLEQAVTWLNMANAEELELGLEVAAGTIDSCLERAEALLLDPELEQNGYYAFFCEKCAPTFDYYGWFVTAKELKTRAERYYAGNGAEQ